MSDLKEQLTKVNDDYRSLAQQYTTGHCWKLSTTLQEFEGALREHIQGITKSEIVQIIGKLRSNARLDKHELDYIKLWIVGDADYYLRLENNYNDWVQELKRLIDEINKIDVKQSDFIAASKLRALLLDGIRVIGDIMFFLQQKERVKNFTESTQEIDPEERELLIRLIEGKIASPNI